MRPKDSSLDSFGAGAHDLEAAGHAQTLAIAAAEGTEVSGAALATSNEDAYKSEWGHTTPSPSASQEGAPDTKEVAEAHKFNEQTNYVSRRKIITVCALSLYACTCISGECDGAEHNPSRSARQIFLACSTVDLVALMDQTTLAVALSIIGSDLGAGSQISWISNAYFL